MYQELGKNIATYFAGKSEVTLQPRGMFTGHVCSMCTFIFLVWRKLSV
jgi:hypothetical protein